MLNGKTLSKTSWEYFEEIEWKINTAWDRLADVIAKYREGIMYVLKNNEAEGKDDQKTLEKLIKTFKDDETWKKKLLETDLWKTDPCKMDFSGDDAITEFWETVHAGSNDKLLWNSGRTGERKANKTEEDELRISITKALKNVVQVRDNLEWKPVDWHLFGWKSTNILEMDKTIWNSKIANVLNWKDPDDKTGKKTVQELIQEFINSVNHTNWNAFYISPRKLDDDTKNLTQRKVAIRIAMFLYCAKKIIDDGKLSLSMYEYIKDIIDSQLIPNEIPKIKWLHNTKVELWYLEPEYEMLKDLNHHLESWDGDIDLWEIDLSAWTMSKDNNLKDEFEYGKAVWLEEYRVDLPNIEIKDADGNALRAFINDGTRDVTSLFAEIWNTKNVDLLVEISWERVKIGVLTIDNQPWAPIFSIKFDSESSIKSEAGSKWLDLPKFPLDFSVKLKWIKNVNNWLEWCKASLTRKYTAKLKMLDGGPTPIPTTAFEETAVISDVSESYEDIISREVENEINDERHKTWKFNVFKRWYLFLSRGRKRKKKIEKKKEAYERTPFTTNSIINMEMAKQATRHDLEEVLWADISKYWKFEKIKREDLVSEDDVKLGTKNAMELKEMSQDYVSWKIGEMEFHTRFNEFVKKLWAWVNQKFLATNVLEKLDAIKNDNKLFASIIKDLEDYVTDHDDLHFDDVRAKINKDFNEYKRDPRFREELLKILWNAEWLSQSELDDKIKLFINNEKALVNASLTNLQIKLDLLTKGTWAYQIKNKDRETWLFRRVHWFDKWPRWCQTLLIGGLCAIPWFAVWWFAGSAIASWVVWVTNAIKKYTHYTKEQNTFEKNLARDYEHEMKEMKKWERIMEEEDDEWNYKYSRFKRYKAKRQLELYWSTTQSELLKKKEWTTKQIVNLLYIWLEKYDNGTIDPVEQNELNKMLLDARARLQSYWALWHNFLKSNDKNVIEQEFYELENALNLCAKHIIWPSATLASIPIGINAYNNFRVDGAGHVDKSEQINYDDLLKKYKDDYEAASKKFRNQRGWLAVKRWAITTGITLGTSAIAQAISGTGMFAKNGAEAVPGTKDALVPQAPTKNVTGRFGLWKYELVDWNHIFKAAQENISNLSSKDVVTLHFWAGTDATPIRAGSALLDHNTYLNKLSQVKDVIMDSSLSNKDALIEQLDSWLWLPTTWFTNADLHWMRCLEAIEETVKWSWNFDGTLNLLYDSAKLDIDWTVVKDELSRISQSFIEINKFVPGDPWKEAVAAGSKKLIVWLPRFSNTFKEKADGKKAA